MNNVLEQLKDRMRSKISDLNYNTWFKPILGSSLNEGSFVLKVPNKFVADWISDYYSDLIAQELFQITDKNLRVCFDVEETEGPAHLEDACAEGAPEKEAEAPLIRSVENLNGKYSFDRFVVGSCNQFAHAACKAAADLPGGHYNPLFIFGGVGLGKTHLLHAIGLQVASSQSNLNIIYVSAEKFMNELINCLRYQRMHDFRKKYRDSCDVLLIDDIQFLGGKERTQEEFFHTFNALHEAQRQIVITGDKLPKDIQGIEERLSSRFEWGLIADIKPPDLETRIAILKKKAEISNLKCPDSVAMFLASSIKSNVRELEGSLLRINAFASLTGASMSVELAQEVMGSMLCNRERTCSIESIQKTVAGFYNLNVSDLKSPRRMRVLAFPRQIAMYLCKKHVGSSFPEIGGKFGGKDHTTVMHACRKIEKLMKTDTRIQGEIAILEKNILH
ncbi:MAG: chromosomal replication initiator protein DnaA [Proteobacteria bacterium]|nr:chromosomal replication initiator protein DnaA [Pseudomonadota bacterium]